MHQLSSASEPSAGHLAPFGEGNHLIGILWRGRGWLAGCTACCLVAAGIYLLKAERLYRATARVLILQQGGRPLSVVNGEGSRFAEGGEDYIPTHALILRSPLVVGKAIEAVGPEASPSSDGPSRPWKAAVREAVDRLTVTRPDRAAKILQVEYVARSVGEAVRIVDAVVKSYSDFLEKSYQRNNGEVVTLITRARDDLSRELKEMEREYREFRLTHPVLMADVSGRPYVNRRLDQWGQASNEAMVKAVQLKSQLELGRKLAADGSGLSAITFAMNQLSGGVKGTESASPPRTAPPEYLRQLDQDRHEFADLYGARSTKVKEIEEQIDLVREHSRESQQSLEKGEVRDLLGSIESSLDSIGRMRSDLDARFEKDLAEAKKTEGDLMAEANLRAGLERQRALFNSVVGQLKQAELVGDYASTTARSIEPAEASPSPVRPLVAVTLALAVVAGTLLGTGAALVSDQLDPRIRSLAEMRRVLGTPLVGQVPQLSADQARRTGPVGMISQSMPRSPSAEAYKVARTNLELTRRSHDRQVVLVTSPIGGEGKTTVASNLAISLAQAGRKVLLVDANLRRPALDGLHAGRSGLGLVQSLRGPVPLDRVVQPTSVCGLDLVAGGDQADNPAELLSSPRFHELVDEARRSYDVVVIDSAPLLTFADASVVATAVDGVLLVVRASVTTREDAIRAVETLGAIGTPVLGALVNGVNPGSVDWPRPDLRGTARTGWGPVEIRPDPQLTFDARRVSYTPAGDPGPRLEG